MSMTWEEADMAGVNEATMLKALADLKSDLEDKFDQVREDRDLYMRELRTSLDKITEHLTDHRVRIATEEQKVKNLESHVYGRRQSDKPADDSALPALTMGDLKRMGISVGVATGVATLASKLWTWFHSLK